MTRPIRLPRYPLPALHEGSLTSSPSDWRAGEAPTLARPLCRTCGERDCDHDDETETQMPDRGPLNFER